MISDMISNATFPVSEQTCFVDRFDNFRRERERERERERDFQISSIFFSFKSEFKQNDLFGIIRRQSNLNLTFGFTFIIFTNI